MSLQYIFIVLSPWDLFVVAVDIIEPVWGTT